MDIATSNDALADLEALCSRLGDRRDPDLVERVRERSRLVRERILRERGLLDVAVDLVRESRDE